MGASNYKKQRASEHKDGLNAREMAELEAAAKKKKANTKYAIIAVVIVLLIAVVLFMNSNLFVTTLPALTVNDTSYPVADVNYYYCSSYMTFVNNYGDYVSIFLDPNTPLEDQACTITEEEQTWADYFQQAAIDNLVQVTAFHDAAVAAGYQLTEEDYATIEELKTTYENEAVLSGYDLDAFMVMNFGEGNNWKNVEKLVKRELRVNSYLNDQYNSFTYTEEQLDAYYEEHAADYDTVEYAYTFISGTADEEAGLDEEAAMAEAADKAQQILDSWNEGDLDAFKAAALGITAQEAQESVTSISGIVNQFAQEPEAGKAFAAESTGGWYVIFVKDVYDCVYPTVDVRHILVKAVDEDADGTYSDAEKQAAYHRVGEIRNEWQAGAADEEDFMRLVALYSEDGGSNTNGGLYEQVYKGYMVEEFDAFCFAGHEVGDYDIVYGESTSYAGYHLIYFAGENELYSRLLAESALLSADYTALTDELAAPYAGEKAMMWRFAMP